MVKKFNARVMHGGVVQPLGPEDERDETGHVRKQEGGAGQIRHVWGLGQGSAQQFAMRWEAYWK